MLSLPAPRKISSASTSRRNELLFYFPILSVVQTCMFRPSNIYMPMETRRPNVFFQIYCFEKNLKISTYHRSGKKVVKNRKKSSVFFHNGRMRRKLFFLVAVQLVRRSTLDLDIDSAHAQPPRCPARSTNIDDGLGYIRWTLRLWGESLTAASCGILTNLKKKRMPFERMDNFGWYLCTPTASSYFIIRLASSRHMTPPMV